MAENESTSVQKDLGIVSAYGYAKAAGYIGTEEDFEEIFLEFTENAPGLLERLDDAVDAAEAAQAAAEDAKDAVDETIEDAVTAAVAAATEAVEDAKDAAIDAKDAAEAAETAAETAAATFETDTTLAVSGKAADAKVTGDEISELKTALSKTVLKVVGNSDFTNTGKGLQPNTGALIDISVQSATDLIPCNSGGVLYIKTNTTLGSGLTYAFFAENDRSSFVIGARNNNSDITLNIPASAKYVSFAKVTANTFEAFVPENGNAWKTANAAEIAYLSRVPSTFNIIFASKKAWQQNGTFVDTNDYDCKYTTLIPCVQGMVFRYRGHGESATPSALFYDSNLNLVGYATENTPSGFRDITTPANASYVLFNSYANTGSNVILEVYNTIDIDKQTPSNQILQILEDISFVPKIATLNGSLLNNRGEVVSGTADTVCKYTGLIPCKPTQKFYYRGRGIANYASASFRKYNGEYLSSQIINDFDAFTEITVPSDAYFAQFQSFNDYDDCFLDVMTEEHFNEHKNNVLFAKKWTICGDSFSEGSYTSDDFDASNYDYTLEMQKTYGYFIGKRNYMNINQMAHSGYALSDFMGIYEDIPTDSEYITLAFGLNDTSRETPIGNRATDTATDQTYYGYWNTIMSWIIENCPDAKIGILSMPAYMNADYRNANKQIAIKYGVSYFDLYSDEKTPMFMNKYNADSTVAANVYDHWRVEAGNNHPSTDCHKFMSTFIENWLRAL